MDYLKNCMLLSMDEDVGVGGVVSQQLSRKNFVPTKYRGTANEQIDTKEISLTGTDKHRKRESTYLTW